MSQELDAHEGIFCVITYHNEFERLLQIDVGECLIGRADDCGIWLLDPYVSRKHARLCWTGACVTICDIGSRNGTIINGKSIDKHEVTLGKECEIQIGPYRVKICFRIGEAVRQSAQLGHINDSTRSNIPGSNANPKELRPLPTLTPAQRRVFDGFVEGLSEKEIAYRLSISQHTVHSHAKAIYRLLAVSSRGELLKLWASQMRLPNQ